MKKLALSDEILLSVEHPERYIGGEINSVVKKKEDVDIRFAMCFPDVYEIGMSHLGIQILYEMLYTKEFNAEFASWKDTLDYDCDAKENAERFKADRIEYVRTHLDRERYVYRLDTELAGEFVKFYKESFAE